MLRGLALASIGLALVAAPAMAKKGTPSLRGVVEGYYGRPWSGEARRDVLAWMGAHGLDTFVYGPKNDPFHRDRWREPYPADALADLRATARAATRAKVRFVYALSPGLDVCFACKDDFKALTAKLRQLARARVRHFALFFDDLFGRTTYPEDAERYGGTEGAALALAHADLSNRVDRWLRRRGLPGLLFIVPSEYAGTECNPYLDALGRKLRRGMPVGWTGSGVFAATLTGTEADARAQCIDRPIVLWDNFPVNDTILSSNLHLGPLTGRDGALARALRGHLLNPMTQAHSSLVALGTAAAYFRDPDAYDPEAAWQATLGELDASGGLATLAAQVRSSALDLDDARALAAAVDGVERTYAGPDWDDAIEQVLIELGAQASAPVLIRQSLGGTPLGAEIAPWVAELEAHVGRMHDAVELLEAMKPEFEELEGTITGGMLRVTGFALPPRHQVIAALGPGFATAPAIPDFGAFTRCLGDVLGADIAFCPEFGLNVHGKALYVVPTSLTRIDVTTGRNVHDRFLAFVAARQTDFLARQGPGADALAVTLEGAPIALAPDGGFDVTIPLPPTGRGRLVATTAAGDATALLVP